MILIQESCVKDLFYKRWAGEWSSNIGKDRYNCKQTHFVKQVEINGQVTASDTNGSFRMLQLVCFKSIKSPNKTFFSPHFI